MKIIKFLLCWLKARFVILRFKDFDALCTAFDRKHSKLAKCVLKTYFSAHTPTEEELDRIYVGENELKWLYLSAIQCNRHLPDYEALQMVRYMPFNSLCRFPAALPTSALKELFLTSLPHKIGIYVSDFSLPSNYESQLVEACCKEKEQQFKGYNSYRQALLCYLRNNKQHKLMTPDIQLAILALDDEEITVAMIENCTLSRNPLFLPTLHILVEQGSLNSLRALLFHSFIEPNELAETMLQRFPQLRRMYDISCLRRPLHKLERETGRFLGTEAPSQDELKFIIKVIDSDVSRSNRKFMEEQLIPRLDFAQTTPYFCAWSSYEFPEVSEKAYQRIRKIAKRYRDCYKK